MARNRNRQTSVTVEKEDTGALRRSQFAREGGVSEWEQCKQDAKESVTDVR